MTNALTRFGQHCRHLRSSQDKTMGDQAEAFGCAIHFISSIETGKVPLPENYVERFRDWLNLSADQYRDLVKRRHNNVINLQIVRFTRDNSKSMRLFRKISKMSPGQIRNFRKKPQGEAKDDG
jgi:hypothetical protein